MRTPRDDAFLPRFTFQCCEQLLLICGITSTKSRWRGSELGMFYKSGRPKGTTFRCPRIETVHRRISISLGLQICFPCPRNEDQIRDGGYQIRFGFSLESLESEVILE